MPQAQLLKYLEIIGGDKIGMDCSIMPTKFKDIFQISTTDFFYPLVDDPYIQGRIACANVLSDMYSMGVVDCDNMLMLLGVGESMSLEEKDVTTSLMIKGFNDEAQDASTQVTGGQTVKNPWPVIGGVAMSVLSRSEFILPVGAVEGDVLVLTKPLGTNLATNLHNWMPVPDKWSRVEAVVSREDAKRAYEMACESMTRLNRNGARLMHKHGAHAATDVTGFGILGHANNLASNQTAEVTFVIHTLPTWRGMIAADKVWAPFKLQRGLAAETSGGLLVALPRSAAEAFIADITAMDGQPAWIVGDVVAGDKTARLADTLNVIEI